MKVWSKWSLVVVLVLLHAFATVARADIDYTYQFIPIYGPSPASGGTITIDGTTLSAVAWDITDGTSTLNSALTSSTPNSAPGATLFTVTTASSTGFTGSLLVYGYTSTSTEITFELGNFGPGFYSSGASGFLAQEEGNWEPVPAPDFGTPFEVLLPAAGMLAIWRRRAGAVLLRRI